MHLLLALAILFVQDGKTITPKDGAVTLARKPFAFRVVMREAAPLAVNVDTTDDAAKRVANGFDMAACAEKLVFPCDGLVFAMQANSTDLMPGLAAQYFPGDDAEAWTSIDRRPLAVTYERTVATLAGTPLAQLPARRYVFTFVRPAKHVTPDDAAVVSVTFR